jgi:cation diffusion facilitator CzcD-associated flavoprotein CzcO
VRFCYNFDTKEKLWTITTENTSTARKQFTPVSLSLAVAVIIIEAIPQFTDQSSFEGKIIHPQNGLKI